METRKNKLSVDRNNYQLQSYKPYGTLKSKNENELDFNFQTESNERRFKKIVLAFFIESFCLKKKVHLKEFLEELERTILITALSKFNGNQRNTAKFLGIKYTTLNEKVKKYNISIHKKPIQSLLQSVIID